FGFFQRLAFHPLGGEGAGGDGRTTAVGLELGVFDDTLLVDLDLQSHHVATGRRADHAGTDRRILGVELADVTGVFVVVDDLITVCHGAILVNSDDALCSASVGRPLDRGNIHTILVHVPQGGKFTQLGDRLTDLLRRVVHFLFGSETPKGEADRAVRQLIVATQSAQ